MIKFLEEVEGVGRKTSGYLNKLGIYNVNDLINYYPKRYEIIKRSDMRYVNNGDKVIIDGIVEGQPTIINLSSKLKKIIFRISSDRSIYNITVYNQMYLYSELRYGMSVIVIGKYDKFKNCVVAGEIKVGKLSDIPKIESVYYTTGGLSKKMLSKYINNALNEEVNYDDYIPDYIRDKYNFMNKKWCVEQIHNPVDVISLKKARQRIKYEELFLYLLKINYLKYVNSTDEKVIVRDFCDEEVDKFISSLSFELTSDQMIVIDSIKSDLKSKKRMNRLIQGDVGSGKTIVAFVASYMNYLSGYQTALMVPTEILAVQHYENAVRLFENFGVRSVLLTSSISKKEKQKIYEDISNGKVDLIIGTQSLIQDGLEYANLGLIITDEQHRFGVKQREKLKNKGVFPDVLSMSATPIPRTYALTIYGDMDISSIKTKPKGRKEIITYFKKDKEILDVLRLMKNEIDLGHQIYVIAPSIDSDDGDSIDNVSKLSEKMELAFGKICKIGVVHGKLDNDVKNDVMSSFESGNINILISTTVIEVGVNVPNASMIVIFNANLFGLSTLHQLRGRVGRGDIQSYCVLISKDSCERLKMLESCNDGFEISEYDFINRGEGDLFGIRQSGDAEFKIANIKKDYKMLLRVREDINEFMDLLLKNDKYNYILKYLNDSCDLS